MAHKPNHLVDERSPYLQQHVYNPVDWYPWGDAAFEKARSEDKPIFLSIGYSTCHWCHVMERESFEDETVAQFLNEHFISIKVDREERPDVDAIYMAAVQAMNGQGGWPMTVFMTPALKPFFGSTYFPPQPAYGRPSFLQLIQKVADLWSSDRASLEESGEALAGAIAGKSASAAGVLDRSMIDATYSYFVKTFDDAEGGWGNAPKFPRPVQFDFLFSYYALTGDPKALEMSTVTLDKMGLGGLHDHLGGGFHRYSVDRYWRVSHFEKMLYDNAQLMVSYTQGWQATKNPFYREVVEDIARYVLNDMRHPEGGFYSAEDADSEGEEGTYYVWTSQELRDILGVEDARIALYYYGFSPQGNFEHGKNVLHISHTIEEAASAFETTPDAIRQVLSRVTEKLRDHRSQRIRPHLDDKVLTSWNGLMIGALAKAGAAFNNSTYIDAATRAGDFVWNVLRKDGELLHRYREGETKFYAYLESFAFLISGYLELYTSTAQSRWLERAVELQAEQDRHLWDESGGGYFMSRASEDLLIRTKNEYDGAEPSGNSVAVINLIRLAQLTGDPAYRERAERTAKSVSAAVANYPFAMPLLMAGIMRLLTPDSQIVLAARTAEDIQQYQREVFERLLPMTSVIYNLPGATAISEFAQSLEARDGAATAYVCRDFTCELPTSDLDRFRTSLNALQSIGWEAGE